VGVYGVEGDLRRHGLSLQVRLQSSGTRELSSIVRLARRAKVLLLWKTKTRIQKAA
jgi:hypothetical protein